MKLVLTAAVLAVGTSTTNLNWADASASSSAFVPSVSSSTRPRLSSATSSSSSSSSSSSFKSPYHDEKRAARARAVRSGSGSGGLPAILPMASFLENLPNPFSDNGPSTSSTSTSNPQNQVQPRPPSVPPPISNDPDSLFLRAKAIVASDLGLRDTSILAPNFVWVGPNVASTGTLNRDEYIAAGQFFNLRSAFPDLDYRAHDFRLDVDDPSGLTVRLTSRTVGTLRGELRLRSETLPPNGKRMVCPPEAISMTFDDTSGKLVKLCSGFSMDRLVGNTGGLCGVMAAATVAGSPPSEWEVYPPSVVVGRFFRRSVQQLVEPDQFFLAPFPESVMIQLAKGVLAAENGVKDPDLLSGEFTFCGPTTGPLSKLEFMAEFGGGDAEEVKSAFPDLEENYSNFRVDPYDPYRVWYDVKSTGTRTGVFNGKEPDGKRFIGPPEAASMTFDDDGFCTRMTGGAVMDPTDCNTGGLGGTSGILYAAGTASPIAVRPLPQILSRLQKGLLSPLTGKDVDDFATVTVDETKARPIPAVPTPPPTPPQEQPPMIIEREEAAPEATLPISPPTPPQVETKATPPPPKPPKISTPPTLSLLPKAPKISLPEIKAPLPSAAAEEDNKEPTISGEPSDPVTEVFSSFFSPPSPRESTKDTSAEEEAKLARKKEAEEKRKAALAAAEERRRDAEEKRTKALVAAEEKRRLAEEKKDALKKAEKALNKAKPRATISLGFFGFGLKPDTKKEEQSEGAAKGATPAAGAPRGVPTIKNWRQKSDGSITGLIYGSRLFGAGESITTSPIQGKPSENAVVQTKTGSKYYLGTKSVVGNKGLFGFGGGGGAKKSVSPVKTNKKTVVVKKDTSKEDALAKRRAELEAENRAKAEAAAKRKEELEAERRAKAEEARLKREELAEAAARKKEEAEAAKKAKAEAAASQRGQAEAARQAKAEAAARKKEEAEAAKKAKAEAALRKKEEAEAAKKAKAEVAARKKEEAEAARQTKAEAALRKKEEAEAARQAKAEAALRKKEEAEAAKKAKAEAAARRKEEAEAAKKAKAEAAARKKEELEAAKRVKAEALAKKKEELAKKSNAKTTLEKRKSGTISLGASSESSSSGLFSFGKGEKKPPAGVPVISRWKKNPDGSITGMISGSKAFKEGEKVTTSKLAAGQTVVAGSVVVTASGSKYFLK